MGNLINTEFLKLKKSVSYKFILIAFFVVELLLVQNEISVGVNHTGVLYTGMQWIYKLPTQAAYYVGFLFLFAADFVAGEFGNRTFTAAFWCGHPRGHILWAKAAVYLSGLLPFLLIHAVTGPALWTIQFGFGSPLSLALAASIGRSILYCLIGFLVFGCISYLCVFLTGSRIGALSLSWAVVYVLGVLAGNSVQIKYSAIREALVSFFRLTVFFQLGESDMDQIPFTVTFFSSLVWMALLLFAAKVRFDRQDLK